MSQTAVRVMTMRISTFFFTLRQGIKNIFRNKMFSLASVATMAACIFMFGLFYIVVTNFNSMLLKAEESVAVIVYFEEGTSEADIKAFGGLLGKRTEVAAYKYVSADEAWEYVKENYFEGRTDLAAAFEGDNPVANSMHYEINLSDVKLQSQLVKYLKAQDHVREVKESEQVAEKLSSVNKFVTAISAAIIFILLAVSIFLISNTVSVGISVRKQEIGIMKLIGATDYLVRAPFIVEGILIGLVGAALPLVLLYFLYDWGIAYVYEKFSAISAMLSFVEVGRVFDGLVPISLLLGVGIGLIGSVFTTRKHIKV